MKPFIALLIVSILLTSVGLVLKSEDHVFAFEAWRFATTVGLGVVFIAVAMFGIAVSAAILQLRKPSDKYPATRLVSAYCIAPTALLFGAVSFMHVLEWAAK